MITPAALQAAADGNLENFLAASTPGGIERQEAAGQQRLVGNTNLPKDVDPASKAALEAAGVVFGTEVVDNIFVAAKLPDGWKKQATEHSMWSELLDDKGRKRASIFFKAAFYDYNAHMRANRRYGVDQYIGVNEDGTKVADDNYRPSLYETWVTDCHVPIHRIGVRKNDEYKVGEEHSNLANKWLDENFPQWKDAAAYW